MGDLFLNMGLCVCILRKNFPFPIILVVFLLFRTPSYGNQVSFISGQLHNGLTYYIHHDPHAKKHTSLDFIVRAGSLDEQEDERGFSHLIEHDISNKIQFKGKKIVDERCAIWDSTCPQIGAVTSYVFTQYHLEISRALPGGLEEGLLGFFNVLSQCSLDQQCLQDAKNEVLQEFDLPARANPAL